MLGLFGFGKKRKVSRRKTSRKVSKGSKKPAAKVVRMCKKFKVKMTMKRGSKRIYKPTRVLLKLCKRKMKMLKKKMLKARKGSKKSKKSTRKGVRKNRRKSSIGSRFRFGASGGGSDKSQMMFGAPRSISFGAQGMEFGKKRRSAPKKISKASAMKAFKAFYRRHCTSSAMGRGSRFGNGGNPPLYQSMGYEFCPLGSGGVLGANSTGLFPSPCHSMNAKEAAAEQGVKLGKRYGGDAGPMTAREEASAVTKRYVGFGKKRQVVRRRKPKMLEFGRRRKPKMLEFGRRR